MTLYFASHNAHKVAEIQSMISGGVIIKSLKDLNLTEEIPETADTIEQNAILKARFVYERFQLPVFADDTGLEVDTLNGAPGVYSARYAGEKKNDQANVDLLLKNLNHCEQPIQRTARFKTVICLIDKNGKEHLFTGIIDGMISKEIVGDGGFGYDPVFVPKGYEQTFAQMSMLIKNSISHRFLAFSSLVKFISETKNHG